MAWTYDQSGYTYDDSRLFYDDTVPVRVPVAPTVDTSLKESDATRGGYLVPTEFGPSSNYRPVGPPLRPIADAEGTGPWDRQRRISRELDSLKARETEEEDKERRRRLDLDISLALAWMEITDEW